ncbi:MAG TPA: riboflavin biosynthesis protein RibF [Chitinophagaceae bacterium]|nr:riboflavin biosynthesis protein RibF [Chitinophagaceae bacterium]HMZ46987.1 riboflavin biosynthesis protein RibF [Chitinophagaceae bacterium]HNJ57935.1 riboflavin biosynthesis protein RibF [Chitinophagaceae bacterium]HNL81829.1 riboflavin biosynthesis protein RibF [Chitinophagaceae bacterium]HNM35368.1 riboflavin biosynthesis protein RibF [Chitinophagaceae bacterium]
MKVFKDLNQLLAFNNAVITIGTFDGVHEGHKKILKQLKEQAITVNGESIVITFYPHPRKVVGDTTGVLLLTTLEEKIELLKKELIDNVVVVEFNEDFANQTAEEYISDFLFKKFKPHTLIIGYDHHFGYKRKGNYELLEKFGQKLGFSVKEIDEKLLSETAISSTRIRKALLQTDLYTAKQLLGYDYFIEGKVIEGDKLGRTIGYPTANLQLHNEEKLVPGDGVYAVEIIWNKQPLQGMLYIGSRPVVNGKRRVIEVNIFNFNETIYQENLKIIFQSYIRADINMSNFEELKRQLDVDKTSALTFFKNSK